MLLFISKITVPSTIVATGSVNSTVSNNGKKYELLHNDYQEYKI